MDFKKIFKKYTIYGFIVSLILILLNFFIRPNFFPYANFENSFVFYLIYLVIAIIISITFGFLYELIKSNISNKYFYYIILTLLTLLYFSLLTILLFFINIFISFNRTF